MGLASGRTTEDVCCFRVNVKHTMINAAFLLNVLRTEVWIWYTAHFLTYWHFYSIYSRPGEGVFICNFWQTCWRTQVATDRHPCSIGEPADCSHQYILLHQHEICLSYWMSCAFWTLGPHEVVVNENSILAMASAKHVGQLQTLSISESLLLSHPEGSGVTH